MHRDWADAIKRGDVASVRGLLDSGVEINGRDRYGQTGLMLAARAGHREVVEALIERRADLNVTAKFGLSALMLAVVSGHAEIARILARAGADLSKRGTGAPGFADQTAHDLAMARGMRQLAEELAPPADRMTSDDARCADHHRFMKIDAAFRIGDLAGLREALDDPASVPNGPMPTEIGSCLEYAIYHSPRHFIRTLLELGADVTPSEPTGFPPLIAALSCSGSRPGAPGRADVADIIAMLLEFEVDPNQRGINDYTALHMAVSEGNLPAVRLLLEAGADPKLRTRIDDCDTPREMAEKAGLDDIARALAMREAQLAG